MKGVSILAQFGLCVVAILSNGWAFTALYGWFVVPLFPSLPPLRVIDGIALRSLLAFLLPLPEAKPNETTYEKISRILSVALFGPTVVLIVWLLDVIL